MDDFTKLCVCVCVRQNSPYLSLQQDNNGFGL